MSKRKSSLAQKKIVNACCVYDFTLFDDLQISEIRETLKKICKKYCFQKEKGENSNKIHYQGRLNLMVKKRENELIKILQENWKKFHVSITSNKNKNNNFYVMKSETRVDGPFTDENDIYIPPDVLDMISLRPWQKTLRDMLLTYDQRTVDVIFEEIGNKGKTALSRYMMIYDNAEVLPFCNDYKDIMRMAYDIGPKDVYIIDMPRAINKQKLFEFFSGIETLKSGYCYDDRYCFKKRLFKKPRICLFTNVKPDLSYLSKDMWKLWTISEDLQLVPYNVPAGKLKKNVQYEFISDSSNDDPSIEFFTSDGNSSGGSI